MSKKQKIVCIAMCVTAASAMAGSLDDLAQYIHKVATKDQKSPKIYLAPGSEINIEGRRGGKVVRVFGEDLCPKDYRPPYGESIAQCIALDKPTVNVRFENQFEMWTVKKVGDKISLVRPNGVLVSQA